MTERAHPAVERKLESLREQLLRMGGLAESILEKAIRALLERDQALARQVLEDDLAIDRLDVEIDRAVLELLALQAPVANDLRHVIGIKTAALDLERVGDLSRDIAEAAMRYVDSSGGPFPSGLEPLAAACKRALASALTAFADCDAERARAVRNGDDEIDADEHALIEQATARIEAEPGCADGAVQIILVAKALERVGDHATNIAEDVIMVAESVNLKHAEKIGEPADATRATTH